VKYSTKALKTKYWTPNTDYLKTITNSAKNEVQDSDILVISEKAVSIALGRIIDESNVKPRYVAKILASFWMRKIWGYILGPICHLEKQSIERLREYPLPEGSAHKQVALEYAGLTQALRHGSEGGIDVSNLPYAYACLPLNNPEEIARTVREAIWKETGKKVAVLIVDTDKTYSFRNLHITPRPNPMKGIKCLGLFAYLLGRILKLRPRSTPLASAGLNLTIEQALRIAAIANKARGYGAGKTAWDVANRFGVKLTEVTWQMLEKVKHSPIVIVRKVNQ